MYFWDIFVRNDDDASQTREMCRQRLVGNVGVVSQVKRKLEIFKEKVLV